MSAEQKEFSHLAIVTHESYESTFNSCVVDDLTEYWYCIGQNGTKLHTYVCAPDAAHYDAARSEYGDGLTVVSRPGYGYGKTLVARTAGLKHIPCEIMVILCHGEANSRLRPRPSLTFFDDVQDARKTENELCVWTRAAPAHIWEGAHASVLLHDIVDTTDELVMLMSCDAGDIVEDYLKAGNRLGRREFFYFSGHGIPVLCGYCIEILIKWLINLVDGPPCPDFWEQVRMRFRKALFRVMAIVKLFGDDSVAFWEYLTTVGLVAMTDDIKKQQRSLFVDLIFIFRCL